MKRFLVASLMFGSVALAQAPAAAPADPLPPANPKFFQAASPTKETVESFLYALWGYDADRVYRTMAIMPTSAPGVTKVVVFVASKAPGAQVQSAQFFVLPDGKHAIADSSVIPFGAKPFAEDREKMKAADGAARGAASKDFMLVEFADLQCPHCKDAQASMDALVKDFPKARVVYQPFPLTEIHPFAAKGAAYGNCIAAGSQSAFFVYAADVFEHQESLTDEAGDQTLTNAVVKAGADPKAIAACAATPAAQKKVADQIAFAQTNNVTETPMLSVNGHLMPIGGMAYETLKQIVAFQMKQDGIQ